MWNVHRDPSECSRLLTLPDNFLMGQSLNTDFLPRLARCRFLSMCNIVSKVEQAALFLFSTALICGLCLFKQWRSDQINTLTCWIQMEFVHHSVVFVYTVWDQLTTGITQADGFLLANGAKVEQIKLHKHFHAKRKKHQIKSKEPHRAGVFVCVDCGVFMSQCPAAFMVSRGEESQQAVQTTVTGWFLFCFLTVQLLCLFLHFYCSTCWWKEAGLHPSKAFKKVGSNWCTYLLWSGVNKPWNKLVLSIWSFTKLCIRCNDTDKREGHRWMNSPFSRGWWSHIKLNQCSILFSSRGPSSCLSPSHLRHIWSMKSHHGSPAQQH